MAGSTYLSIITFLLSTIFYFFALKPATSLTQLEAGQTASPYRALLIYFLLVIVSQFMVNASILSGTCGGSIQQNMGTAALYTFIPWIFMFGTILCVLLIFPGFKTAFSDVIGYAYVSGGANRVLTTLLIDKEVQKNLDLDQSSTVEQKEAMERAADEIIKICGNTSVLINQINPDNFLKYWGILTPLMKKVYQKGGGETLALKERLLKLVQSRDNVGEAFWYIYSGVLITSIVQLKITSAGCSITPEQINQNYQAYVAGEEQSTAAQQLAVGQTYTITQ